MFPQNCPYFTNNNMFLSMLSKELKEFYNQKIALSLDQITNLACYTVEQSKCNLWFEARKLRITGSKNVHDIKTRVRKSIKKLVDDIIDPKKVDVRSTKYGLVSEARAKINYTQLYTEQSVDVGALVFYNQTWLCVSIDSVVVKDGKITKLLEIKSPSSCKNKPVIDHSNKKSNVKYLNVKNNEVTLVESDVYFTQCQIMLYVTGLTYLDFLFTS